MLGHVAQVGEDLLAHAFVEGTDGADHFHFIRNDVVADAAVDRAEGQHRRLLGQVGAAADDGLRGADQIGGGHDRVHSIPRCRTVPGHHALRSALPARWRTHAGRTPPPA
ncbi:hypothetical protein G6F50_016535 [Rhizopus delemar]|uniref:Uncharacterized protein n=1 Tax=Rhizopus delemar TaxID=936053 RepID=A0A9P6XT15_9FUNG|nr:hypothetical protein G6F50_016535 [Rhizopus delemar]